MMPRWSWRQRHPQAFSIWVAVMVLAGVGVGFVALVALGLSLILPAVRSADGTIRVSEVSDTSAVIVITDAPKGSAYTRRRSWQCSGSGRGPTSSPIGRSRPVGLFPPMGGISCSA